MEEDKICIIENQYISEKVCSERREEDGWSHRKIQRRTKVGSRTREKFIKGRGFYGRKERTSDTMCSPDTGNNGIYV